MSLGRFADIFAGAASRLLHGLRGADYDSLAELEPYLDLGPDEAFPRPAPISDMTERRGNRLLGSATTTLSWTSGFAPLTAPYRRRHEGIYAQNLTAYARWLRPDARPRRSCLVYVHGWLEPGSWVEELTVFPRWSRELGVDVAHLALPFHGYRSPPGALFSGEYFWTADLVRSFEAIRQAVHDLRALVAWLRSQGYEHVGVTGISLGGAIVMLAACLAPTPDYLIPIVAHLELEDAVENAPILWRMKHDLERQGAARDRRREIFTRLGLSSFSPVIAPARQLWIEARDDLYIDAALVERQWEAWGRPPIHWIPGGHMTFPLYLGEMTRAMANFARPWV